MRTVFIRNDYKTLVSQSSYCSKTSDKWWEFWHVVYIQMIHGIVSPHEDGEGFIFQGHWWVCFFIWTIGGLLYMGGVTIRDFPGGLQYQFFSQLANAEPKSVKVNLTNCHRKICKIKFYQIVTSDVLISLWQFDKRLF